ncbi:dihydroneopterin aldolase [Primorskyibacter sp. S87]|uniref:dihydroneopterin aldolase n=1 Tax=Primorskyibacter sp. S87 TaxID=3415126 RepID=UPI003C7B8130
MNTTIRSIEPTSSRSDRIDRLTLNNFVREIEIGAFDEERGVTQRLKFDIGVEVASTCAAITDDVDAILSYDALVSAVDISLQQERVDLLETLAERIATHIFRFPEAQKLSLAIRKLDRGPFEMGVEIERRRDMNTGSETACTELLPQIVELSNKDLAHPELNGLLRSLKSSGLPVVLTVGLPANFNAPAGSDEVIRQIQFLAIEQNAWRLADCEPRVQIVRSRTELEHCIKSSRLAVWAPAKMVNTSFANISDAPEPGPALTQWFARAIDASLVADFNPVDRHTDNKGGQEG